LRHGGRIRRQGGDEGSCGSVSEEGATGVHHDRVQGAGYKVQGREPAPVEFCECWGS
jgi:hypothetical protein